MNKIIQKLLKLTYPQLDVDSIMEVVSATPNAELATEILCGLYVEPEIAFTRVMDKTEGVCVFNSYNKWDDKIQYSYNRIETRSAYFPKGTKIADITMENFDSLKCGSSTPECVYLNIPTGVIKPSTSYMSYSKWVDLPYAPTEGEIRQKEMEAVFS
jgi:hypothetical protein